ncbi:non-canonical purine NTP pyrophosphatase [Natrinema sp. LN54]|uniref:non-canonical purine NTP pyrophosphatase n=1 Tax=Natrinema sp. LN54 TaxID=3458705 RepID=UPI004034F7D0
MNENIPILFVTTSKRKYDHLAYLGEREDIDVYHVPKEYEELQRDNLDHLLFDAIQREELDQIRDSFFLIEQTSVFFDAYDDDQGYPGQFFKRWWKNNSEAKLKSELSKERGVRIESGLALNIPQHDPLIFINEQTGRVSFDGEIRDGNEEYSWLSAEDFNLYFIPDGATKVYNEMTVEESLQYDFRKPNLDRICPRIKEYSSILNAEISMEYLKEEAEKHGTVDKDKSSRQSRLDFDYNT